MMKLKYLFDNRELIKMLLGYWEHDENELDILNHYRISSNAIYPFKDKGQVKLLRLAPAFEKAKNNLMAELEFIKYLSLNGYPALKTVLSKGSEELVTAVTPWGNYYATAFERVRGVQISNTDLNNTIIFEYGKALGKLHRLSSRYSPLHKRWSYSDVLSWINSILTEFEKQELALKEVNLLQGHLSKLLKISENYGLVHYDFELDNVFYDKEVCSCNVIDFDDAY